MCRESQNTHHLSLVYALRTIKQNFGQHSIKQSIKNRTNKYETCEKMRSQYVLFNNVHSKSISNFPPLEAHNGERHKNLTICFCTSSTTLYFFALCEQQISKTRSTFSSRTLFPPASSYAGECICSPWETLLSRFRSTGISKYPPKISLATE